MADGRYLHPDQPAMPAEQERFEMPAVDKPRATPKRCPDRRCVAVHTWTWLTDDGDPDGQTYICRPGAPS